MASVSWIVLLCAFFAAYGHGASINMTAMSHVVTSSHHPSKSHSVINNSSKTPVISLSVTRTLTPSYSTKTTVIHKNSTAVIHKSTAHTKMHTSTIRPSNSTAHFRTPTPKPTSTHIPTPPPTIIPPTVPPPIKPKNFIVKKNNTVCMRMKAVIEMDVQYKNSTVVARYSIDNSSDIVYTGVCNNDTRDLKITMGKKLKLNLSFIKPGSSVSEMLSAEHQWKQNLIVATFTNETTNETVHVSDNTSYFHSNLNTFYQCNSGIKINVKNVTFDFSLFEVQPFAEHTNYNKTDGFGEKGDQCIGDDVPTTPSPTNPPDNDIVPIAVGCALAGLVVIVLIAYIIGRRRTHRGYQQV